MKPILPRILIILQKHLNLTIHLRPNIIAKAARDNRQDAETQRAQRRSAQAHHIRLLEGRARRNHDVCCYARDFCERGGAERERGHEGGDGGGREARGCCGGGDEAEGLRGLHVCEDCGVDCLLLLARLVERVDAMETGQGKARPIEGT